MIEINIYNNLSDIESIKDYWEMFHDHPETDFEFFKIIIKNRIDILNPYVLVVLKDNIPKTIVVGRVENRIIPIKIGYKPILQVRLKTFVIFYKGIIGDYSDDILDVICNKFIVLLKEGAFDAIYIDSILYNSNLDVLIHNKIPYFMKDLTTKCTVHWELCLPRSYNEFLDKFNSKHRYWLNRIRKTVIKDFKGNVCIKTQKDFNDYLEISNDIESITKTTYHRKIGVGFKNNNEYHDIIKYYLRSKTLLVYIIYVDGIPSAYWLGVMFRNKIYFGITGYRPEYNKYELGTVVLLKIIEDACNVYDEIEFIDFGFGDAYYKQKFGTNSHVESSLYIFRPILKNYIINVSAFLIGTLQNFVLHLLRKYKIENRIKKFMRKS